MYDFAMNESVSFDDIPVFQDEDKEREFWATHDSTEFIDWKQAGQTLFPKLKPTTTSISLRLSETMLANKRDIPYQSLLKIFLAERVEAELKQ